MKPAAHWFFLSDPESYHFDQLFASKRDTWDGVFGSMAQKYLGEIHKGDRVIGYHTAPEKAAVCELEVLTDAYQNPEIKDKKNWVVDLKAVKRLGRPVPLAALKANKKLSDMKLFHMMRPIAVSPLKEEEYEEIVRMGSVK
jgi:predicted RNA-binding protein with PUA-like domain